MTQKPNRACVFAHFDKNNLVDEYVYYYLQQLLTVTNKIVFVTVVNISLADENRLKELSIYIIKRENVGYDFYSYKTGINFLNITQIDELIVCNDSVYGSIVSMDLIFDKMKSTECDFWGITGSYDISFHTQSYFIVYKKTILNSPVFSNFWQNLKILNSKTEIIEKYEVGFSSLLLNAGFIAKTYVEVSKNTDKKVLFLLLLQRLIKSPLKIIKLIIFPMRYIRILTCSSVNLPILYWEKLLLKHNMPFIKISLFTTDEGCQDNIKKLDNLLNNFPEYPVELIKNHLKRILL